MLEQIARLAIADLEIVGADIGDETARQVGADIGDKVPGSGLETSITGILASLSCFTEGIIATSSTGMKMMASGLSLMTCSTIAFCSSTLSGCFGTKCTTFAPVVRAIWSAAMRKAS